MEVYAIGGKPLMLDGKLCKVAAGGGAETWVLNEIVDVGKFGLDTTLIQFISNSESFGVIGGKDEGGLYYTGLNENSIEVYNEETGLWVNQTYRTITFLEPPEEITFGNIVKWLQANGIKQ